MDGEAAQSVGYLELVKKNPGFRNLWNGQIVSLLGDWFNLIGSAALITLLTGSGLAVGALFVVRMLAPFAVSPLAGVLADRQDRRRLLILCDLSRGVVVLGFLLVRSPGTIWLLYTLTAVQLAISGVFYPARNAILPDVVSESELGAANALSGATWSVMLAVGAALGGIVAGLWGIYPSFVIDSASFFVSAFFISRVAYRTAPVLERGGGGLRTSLAQYGEGLSYLRDHRDVLSVAVQKGTVGLLVNGAFQVLQVAIAERVFVIGEGGSTSLGMLYAVVGVGAGLGPIVARRVVGDRLPGLRAALMVSFFLAAVGLATVAPLLSFALVLAGTLVRALGTGTIWVLSTQMLLQMVPGKVRGRVFSVEFAIFTLATAVGSALGGWALDGTSLGITGLLTIMTVAALVPALLWGVSLVVGRPRSWSGEPAIEAGLLPSSDPVATPSADLAGEDGVPDDPGRA